MQEPQQQAAALLGVSYRNASSPALATGCYYLLCLVLAKPIAAYCKRYQQDHGAALEQLWRLVKEGRPNLRESLKSSLRSAYRKEQRAKAKEQRFAESQPTTTKPQAAPLLKGQLASLNPKERLAVEAMKAGARVSDLEAITGQAKEAAKSTWGRAKKKLLSEETPAKPLAVRKPVTRST